MIEVRKRRDDECEWRELDRSDYPRDRETLERRELLRRVDAEIATWTREQCLASLVAAGTHNPDGSLTEPYRDDGEPSKYGPRDPAELNEKRRRWVERGDWTVDANGYPVDRETLERRALLREMDAAMATWTREQCLASLVAAGTHNPDGTLTEPYRDDGEPSQYGPRD